ncbi:MAG: large-conductance mechanosensitive channel [Candidatus Sungbacteria bacterium RIFCSPLOWO2_02_FULL_51_17]|uniref:Large-conductance mechanosensitive channel n=1 Tax=Candidatus Sungbacteria bacterium RIFCSPHIGHO2_02_FULL_51_29 TaxID=1802273 RepID=A0A1G2KQB7_9BACT|nr:MAG: large-conductance mechanosensitive channel [Candidatus Sungbacteria bacterium RIFCSPHIGHO2_01_FULL_51_22]OHA01620.1 MAG: large-conductance mechanosensitive channel [Candidatus Sungbacteria bacterium RIFCSPHIGHO2_02_FULL_51_29]OHA06432.1 MAG: large-conductance mechanosensitive channel [Candidatus Sungbacteria bacterium RIFCSPLOWO2_01_FULL_51_34]OHA10370.1 MAG: large-conductance mechanosensitive channel [Candidatus Sungbacteria bacterium RIFCSPLOWO2_02_FULL_51_17]
MKIFKEFKEFAVKGNALELAVGVVIGTAFGKIVTSLVNDVIMPPLSVIVGGINFSHLRIILTGAEYDSNGVVVRDAIALNYGNFLQSSIDFIVIAFAVFLMIKALNSFRRIQEDGKKHVAITKEIELLGEIRDILRGEK